jgi:hypothetical protein
MGNKIKVEDKRIDEYEKLHNLYITKDWNKLIDELTLYLSYPEQKAPTIKIKELIKLIILSLPDNIFDLLINIKNINRVIFLHVIKNNTQKLEYTLKSNPQKYLIPTIIALSDKYHDYYIEFLLKLGIRLSKFSILKAIQYSSNSIVLLLLDNYVRNNNKESHILLYNWLLQASILEKRKDIFISLTPKIKFEEINFKKLYQYSNKNMKLFLDNILNEKVKSII